MPRTKITQNLQEAIEEIEASPDSDWDRDSEVTIKIESQIAKQTSAPPSEKFGALSSTKTRKVIAGIIAILAALGSLLGVINEALK